MKSLCSSLSTPLLCSESYLFRNLPVSSIGFSKTQSSIFWTSLSLQMQPGLWWCLSDTILTISIFCYFSSEPKACISALNYSSYREWARLWICCFHLSWGLSHIFCFSKLILQWLLPEKLGYLFLSVLEGHTEASKDFVSDWQTLPAHALKI